MEEKIILTQEELLKLIKRMNEKEDESFRMRILSQQELYEILPFGKTKIKQLLKNGELPTRQVGADYITTFDLLERWILVEAEHNVGMIGR